MNALRHPELVEGSDTVCLGASFGSFVSTPAARFGGCVSDPSTSLRSAQDDRSLVMKETN
jgi:hypothetical protein